MKFSRIILFISILSFTMIFSVGCSSKGKIEISINNYVQLLNEGKYDEFYESLSNKSKEYIETEYGGKEGFINKYSAIYSAMNVSNIKVVLKESNENLNIPVSISMNTYAGELKYDNLIIKLEKEDNEYKISWDESLILPNMIQGDKIRVQTYNGSRGRILDRDGNILAYNGEVNYVYINPKTFDQSNVSNLANVLDISEEYIQNKLDSNSNPEQLVFIVKVSKYDEERASKALEIDGVNVQVGISRVYAQGEAFGSLLGYIGNITAEELENNPDKGYTTSSQIGKNGLEQVYEDKLRAKEGVHIYIERGEEKITVAKTDSKDGDDIQLSIDSNLQQEIYNQMDNEKSASIAMDSTTGEVLAMVSSPSYDSNTLVTYKTKTIAKEWEESKNAEFDNRANNAYSPGSTMKLITASIGLENNVINPNEKMNIKGLTWQNSSSWGNYKVSRVKDIDTMKLITASIGLENNVINPNEKMNIKGLTWQNSSSWGNYKVSRVKDIDSVGLYEATIYSDNIYFADKAIKLGSEKADKAIKLGSEKFISGAKKFGIGADIKFEYPMAKSQISNSGSIEDEILLADTGYGQGEVLTTPLEVTMAYSALANDGKIMTPRIVISENSEPKIYSDTMKLITASIGLENNVINPNEKMNIKGLTWQNSSSWGNYKVSRVKDIESVGLYEAAIYSDNIYFADKAIKLGSEKLIEGAKKFGIGADISFEYPMAKSQISNSGSIDDEILLGDTGYGQGEVLTTPLEVTMAYSALANDGKIMTPRIVISENSEPKIYSEAISKDFLGELKKDFSGVINDPNGSGYLCKIEGINLAGKTGTAEIKSSKDDNNGNENSWFVAVDLDNSKLSISMVMEDMKDKSTSSYLVPKVKNIIKSYLDR